MKILNNNLKIFILTFASLLLGVFLWNKITLPYSNPENVYGILSINKLGPNTDKDKLPDVVSASTDK